MHAVLLKTFFCNVPSYLFRFEVFCLFHLHPPSITKPSHSQSMFYFPCDNVAPWQHRLVMQHLCTGRRIDF